MPRTRAGDKAGENPSIKTASFKWFLTEWCKIPDTTSYNISVDCRFYWHAGFQHLSWGIRDMTAICHNTLPLSATVFALGASSRRRLHPLKAAFIRRSRCCLPPAFGGGTSENQSEHQWVLSKPELEWSTTMWRWFWISIIWVKWI